MIVLSPKDTSTKALRRVANSSDGRHSVLDGAGSGNSRLRGTHVCQLPFEVFLKVLQALKGNFELVGRVEGCRIVEDLDVE